MSSKRVLIVEDDASLAEMYKLKLEKEGFFVKISDNGLSAIAEVTEFQPHVILLDIMMPSMDGFETLRVIRELAPSLSCKIIMFSNLNSQEDIERCMSKGADAYLLKADTTPKQAVEKIHELLQDQVVQSTKTMEAWHICPNCAKETKISIDLHF